MSYMHGIRVLGVCALAVLAVQIAKATPWTATVSGTWTNTATWGGSGTPDNGDDAAINSGVSVTVDVSTASLNNFTNNGTLTFMGWSTVMTATVVQVNGTITHGINTDTTPAPWTPDNRVCIVCTNLTVSSTGSINANAKGYQGQKVSNQISGYGPGGGAHTASSSSQGAGYGGQGGRGRDGFGGITYGSTNAPTDPGSGGGSGYNGYGGNGGGAILIAATGAVTNNGTISADGEDGTSDHSGGGSGGSIYIACTTLSGNGLTSAKGGTIP